MKSLIGLFIAFWMVCPPASLNAQDVYIPIPATNIFNRSELNTVKNILNTGNHTNWRFGFSAPIWPEIWSTTGNNFTHTSLPSYLPTDILHWRLASIGNDIPPFRQGDFWPSFKWFTSNSQTWYQPASTTGGHAPGNVAFHFKIPSDKFATNVFRAGNYTLGVTHNNTWRFLYPIQFTPDSFNVILTVPSAIQWLSTTPTKYIEISSLKLYRSTSDRISSDLGFAQLGNTTEFDLWAKSPSSLIQFTSSKGGTGTRNISLITLGSHDNSNIISSSLSSTWKKYSSSNFKVETGNQNNFTLALSISAADFKTHFYQAGTYTFQLNLDAKSTDNSISALQNKEVTIKVLPLSEIIIPSSGQNVDFNFYSSEHYQQGLTRVVTNQIKISNNEIFELYVKSDSNFLKKRGIQTDINSNILQVGVDGMSAVPLSTTSKKIISASAPVLDKGLNIKYTIPPAAAQSLAGKEKTTYSINIIYSFTAL